MGEFIHSLPEYPVWNDYNYIVKIPGRLIKRHKNIFQIFTSSSSFFNFLFLLLNLSSNSRAKMVGFKRKTFTSRYTLT